MGGSQDIKLAPDGGGFTETLWFT